MVAVTVAVGSVDGGEMVPVQAALSGQQATLLSGSSAHVALDEQQSAGAPRDEHEFPDEAHGLLARARSKKGPAACARSAGCGSSKGEL